MWCPLLLVLLAGAASAEHFQAWKTDTEYQYAVRGRTFSALHDMADQYSGIILRAFLIVQPKSDGTLEAKVTKARYAQIHTKLSGGWNSEIPENMLEFKQFPISEKVFEIKMEHGVVRDLIVDNDVPTWEVNVLKSIASQLQVDTQGENLMASRYNQEPEGERVNAMYKTMEDSVGGRCEVLYDISPLPEFVLQRRPELLPFPEVRGDGEIIDIVKTKNFSNCEQRSGYHFGITGSNHWEPGSSDNGNFLSRSSVSRIIITGDLKTFTIQSSVSTNKVILSPNFYENRKGMVSSRVNVTLVKMGPPSPGAWTTPVNPESTGNLVYNYNNPFAGAGEDRRPGQPIQNRNSEEEYRYHYNRYWRKTVEQNNDDANTSGSSKSAESMESNEKQWYWLPMPTLNGAPPMPLLPFFVGNRGKSIHHAEQVDPVMTAKILSGQIGSDLQNPNGMTEEQTLEKFSILAEIIRTMSTQQIAEAQRELYQSANEIDPHDETQSVRRNTWIAFRDAVAQAGTGPALVTIKNWVKEKKMRGIEAASVVGVLSKTTRTPTQEYMDAFFELATMPETTEEEFLNSTALYTFSELVRYAQSDHASSHNRYPVHTFGHLWPKENTAIVRDYVPYIAEQLKKSIEHKEHAKSLTYIASLGAMAHPKILAIFEPYLEGKTPTSTLQRLTMVISMTKMASLKPVLARGIFYRIYQNTGESHQVRCAAVFGLMTTNPPASMLQRMAEFTNEDYSKHVNAAVKSAIESASELETPDWRELASNARNVRPLLNKESYGFEYSKQYLTDYIDKNMNLAYRMHSGYISSDHSFIPELYYASAEAIFGGFKVSKASGLAMVSSVRDLYKAWENQFNSQKKSGQNEKMEFSPENIAKLLKIKAEYTEDVEGLFKVRTAYADRIMSFDKYTLQSFPERMRKAVAALKDGHNFNIAKIESYDVTVSFPMESGFPFVYTMKVPKMLRVWGSAKGENKPEFFEGSVDLRAVFSIQFQVKLGFVTPFEHQHYLAGINKDYQVYVPIRAKVNYEKSEKRVTLKVEPIEQSEKYKLMHHSVVPFTSRHNIQNMSPIMKDPETHRLTNDDVYKRRFDFGSRTHGIYFKVESEGASSPMFSFDRSSWNWDPLTRLVFVFVDKAEYHKTEVFMEPNQSSDQSVILTGSLETYYDEMTKYDETRSKTISAKAPQVKSKIQNDPTRRRELLQEAAKGIAAADAFAVDFGLEYPGQEPFQTFATVAFANSKVDEKSRGLIYWRLTDSGKNVEFETCAGLESRSPRSFNFDSDMSDESEPKSRKFDIDLRYGKACETGYRVKIQGIQEQSETYRDAIKRLPSTIECYRSMRKGMNSWPACHDASMKMTMMDMTSVTIEYDKAARGVQEVFDDYLDTIFDLNDDVHSTRKRIANDDESAYKNSAELTMFWSPNINKGNFSYESDYLRFNADDVEIGAIGPFFTNINHDIMTAEKFNMDWNDATDHQHMCAFDSNWATTFDESSYPIHLGKCWHVAMTTYPKTTKDSGSTEKIDEDMALSILIRDGANNKKEVKVTLGNKELQFWYDASKVQVALDGKNVDLGEKRSYRHKNGKDIDFEVFERSDGTLRLFSSKYGFDTWYDGQRILIKASGKYRSDVRGLCGNYDGEPVNDFTSPKNCVLSKPEEFAASYALTSSDCQGKAPEFARKAEEAVCSEKSPRPGNVVSEREAGRSSSGNKNWGYHSRQYSGDEQDNTASTDKKHCTIARTKVIEESEQICFSLRPMPTCASGCKAKRTKPKVMAMYCVPKSAASRRMAERVKQGANPDLSQKEFSKKTVFEIPVGCHAA